MILLRKIITKFRKLSLEDENRRISENNETLKAENQKLLQENLLKGLNFTSQDKIINVSYPNSPSKLEINRMSFASHERSIEHLDNIDIVPAIKIFSTIETEEFTNIRKSLTKVNSKMQIILIFKKFISIWKEATWNCRTNFRHYRSN